MTPATELTHSPNADGFDVGAAYRAIRERIAKAEAAAGREPGCVTLVGAAKAQPENRVEALLQHGLEHIGENYWQDATQHFSADPERRGTWHFIGPIQSNKTADIAAHFDWVQSLDREKIASRLNDQRPQSMPPLNVLIQVNVSDEHTKSGTELNNLDSFALTLSRYPNLRLRGLMTIPAPDDPFAHQRIAAAYQQLRDHSIDIDTLSVGMSNDLEPAIAAGSTMVRIGTALFGSRH